MQTRPAPVNHAAARSKSPARSRFGGRISIVNASSDAGATVPVVCSRSDGSSRRSLGDVSSTAAAASSVFGFDTFRLLESFRVQHARMNDHLAGARRAPATAVGRFAPELSATAAWHLHLDDDRV